jgi:hypothetical protein
MQQRVSEGICAPAASGILVGGSRSTDEYGRAFGRSAAEILNVVYLDPQAGSSRGFYPDELNGDIVHDTGMTAR